MSKAVSDNHSEKKSTAKKQGYGGLLVLVGSFLALVLALALATYFATQRFEKVASTQKVITQQSVVVQELTKNLLNINLYGATHLATVNALPTTSPNQKPTATPVPVATPKVVTANNPTRTLASNQILLEDLPQVALYRIDDIKKQRELFNGILIGLKQGGEVVLLDGTTVILEPAQDPQILMHLANIERIWTPYEGLLSSFSDEVSEGILDKNISDYLVEYTRLYNQPLQAELNSITNQLNTTTTQNAMLLRLVQIGGILLSILIFVLIVFRSLRQLVRRDEALAIARQQTDDIMNTVNEGLFLIDKNLVIADQYSGKLEEILGITDIGGYTLYEILDDMIDKKDLDTTKMFVEQLYNTWVVEELIKDLNPLKQVLWSYIDEEGVGVTKFLEFNFSRVMDDNKEEIESVFVSVVDVTNEVRLESQMQKDKEQHGREIEMIGYLLSVDNRQLIHFLDETKVRILRMNDILKEHRSSDADLRDKANQLYRETHSLKGDASAVKLSALVGLAERQEDKLNMLLMQHDLKGDDFLPVTVGLDEMMERVAFIERIVQSLNLRGEAPALMSGIQDGKQAGYWQGYFVRYAKDIADRQGKMVQVRVSGFDDEMLDEGVLATYKDIATQLLKNAIVHGIESTEARIAHGKDKVGKVNVSLADDLVHQAWVLKVEDDGAGIDWGRLRQKAVEMGAYDQETAASLKPQELIKLMFVSGISTADKQDEDAGRGVGMDIVKRLAAEQGGKIGINSRPNQFTQMSITFPKTV